MDLFTALQGKKIKVIDNEKDIKFESASMSYTEEQGIRFHIRIDGVLYDLNSNDDNDNVKFIAY